MRAQSPPVSAVNDALAILHLVRNPEEAGRMIEALKAETDRHIETVNTVSRLEGLQRDVNQREAAMQAKEAELAELSEALAKRAQAVQEHQETLEKQQREHTDLVTRKTQDISDVEVALAAERTALDAAKMNFEQTSKARLVELDNREKAIAEREATHAERVNRMLKEFA